MARLRQIVKNLKNMCGIVGYIGPRRAEEFLLNGLSRLEYRGYDSAGVAIIEEGAIHLRKKQGKLKVLADNLASRPLGGSLGVGHTRWATHGAPNETNAHPHLDCKGKIAVVHNGIIENYLTLKKSLAREGHKFISETDTETIVHLIEKFYKGDLERAVRKAAKLLKGSYAIAAIHKDEPNVLVGARCDSPLIVGVGKNENFLASDVPALLDYTKDVIYLDNNQTVAITREGVAIRDYSGKTIINKPARIKWDISQAEKAGYSHFMLKEIFEQADIIEKILDERLKGARISFDELKIRKGELRRFKKISIVACGTAYHAGLTGRYMIEEFLGLPCMVDTSSEFRYRDPVVDRDTLVIVISQS